jgi:hypothetical protein
MISFIHLLICLGAVKLCLATAPPGYPTILLDTANPVVQAAFIVAGLIGLFLVFNGRRFFKPFLAIVGFAAGFTLAVIILLWLDIKSPHPIDKYKMFIPFIAGITLAGLCLWFYKMALFSGAAAGGFYLGLVLLSLKDGALIPNGWGRIAFLSVTIAICVVLAHFFEFFITTVASALIGSFAATAAVDVFMKTGFLETALESIQVREIKIKQDTEAYGVIALFLGLAASGIVTQFINKKKLESATKGHNSAA